MDGGAGVRASVSLGTLLEWHMIAANDMTGDAKDDILLEHTTDGRRVLWGMNGGQVGMAVLLGTMGLEWQIAGTGDIEGNGKDDILWQRIDNGLRAAWLMNGTGGVISAPALTVESPSWDIAAVLIPDNAERSRQRLQHLPRACKERRRCRRSYAGEQQRYGHGRGGIALRVLWQCRQRRFAGRRAGGSIDEWRVRTR
jgi:hypothetical protein